MFQLNIFNGIFEFNFFVPFIKIKVKSTHFDENNLLEEISFEQKKEIKQYKSI